MFLIFFLLFFFSLQFLLFHFAAQYVSLAIFILFEAVFRFDFIMSRVLNLLFFFFFFSFFSCFCLWNIVWNRMVAVQVWCLMQCAAWLFLSRSHFMSLVAFSMSRFMRFCLYFCSFYSFPICVHDSTFTYFFFCVQTLCRRSFQTKKKKSF